MNVNSTHFEHKASLAGWSRARVVMADEDAVKAVGKNYLSRLHSQTNDEHRACGLSLSFCNATARTTEPAIRTACCVCCAMVKSSLTGEATKRRNACS